MFSPVCPRRRAFTLVEMLVALAIVGILVVMINQIMGSASATTMRSQKNLDAASEAQFILDRMAIDFGQMPLRSDVDYEFADAPLGSGTIAFYSTVDGLASGSAETTATARTLSVVGYKMVTDPVVGPVLERGARQLDWSGGGLAGPMQFTMINGTGGQIQAMKASSASTLPPVDPLTGGSNYQIFGDQIFRFDLCYLVTVSATAPNVSATTQLQTTAPASISNLSAIVVGIAVLDTQSRSMVSDYTKLALALPNPQPGKDILAVWTPALNDPNFPKNAGIPSRAAQAVRIFQRYFYLRE